MKRLGIAALVAVVIGAASVTGAAASPPMPASGTVTTASILSFDLVRSAGGNDFIDVTGTTAWTGTFSGTSTEVTTLTFHANGDVSLHAISTFVGTFNGVAGTVTFELTGRAEGDVIRTTATIISATGGLAGLHGVVIWQGTVGDNGPVGTYSGQVES